MLFDLVGHILSLARHDCAFAAEAMLEIGNIYRIQIPPDKMSITLKWKRTMLDTPIFRQPVRTAHGYRTSPTEPLRASTWNYYLKRLGRKTGLEHAFTHYVIRRANCNAVNGKSHSARMSFIVLMAQGLFVI